MRRLWLAAVVMSLAACSGSEAPAQLALPEWEQLGAAGLDAEDFTPTRLVAGDKGFVLAGHDSRYSGKVYVSDDGRRWTRAIPTGTWAAVRVAGDGKAVFLAGLTASAQVRVFRYDGDGVWTRIGTLNPAGRIQELEMSAGAEGVHIAVVDLMAGPDVRLFSAADGRDFSATTATLPGSTFDVLGMTAARTSIGTAFVSLSIGQILRLTAAGTWTGDFQSALPPDSRVDFIAVNGDRLALFGTQLHRLREGDPGFVAGEDPMGNNDTFSAVSRCMSRGGALVEATVDPGTLPDLAVTKGANPHAVVPYRTGFMMVGFSLSQMDGEFGRGGLWISDDGCRWRKDKVQANGFYEVDSLIGVAVRDDRVVLVGRNGDGHGPVIWVGSVNKG